MKSRREKGQSSEEETDSFEGETDSSEEEDASFIDDTEGGEIKLLWLPKFAFPPLGWVLSYPLCHNEYGGLVRVLRGPDGGLVYKDTTEGKDTRFCIKTWRSDTNLKWLVIIDRKTESYGDVTDRIINYEHSFMVLGHSEPLGLSAIWVERILPFETLPKGVLCAVKYENKGLRSNFRGIGTCIVFLILAFALGFFSWSFYLNLFFMRLTQ